MPPAFLFLMPALLLFAIAKGATSSTTSEPEKPATSKVIGMVTQDGKLIALPENFDFEG